MRERIDTDNSTDIQIRPSATSLADPKELRIDSLQAKNEVAAPDQAPSHLIANLVHDLRTPLVAIRGYTKMILEGRAGPINDMQREFLTIAAENTNRVIQLLNQLAQLTRTQPLHLEAFDARDLCRETLALVRLRAPGMSAKITERISPVPLVIFGDKRRLTEVLADLLLNANKFTDQGSEIVVELSGCKEGEVAITISGTGLGISRETSGKVFSGRVQPESSPSGDSESFGAELSVVQDIIRLHGGHFSVSSKLGEGGTILITLPAL